MREVSTAAGIYALRLLRDRRSGRLGQMAVLPPTRCSKHDNNVSLPCGSAKILILMHQEPPPGSLTYNCNIIRSTP